MEGASSGSKGPRKDPTENRAGMQCLCNGHKSDSQYPIAYSLNPNLNLGHPNHGSRKGLVEVTAGRLKKIVVTLTGVKNKNEYRNEAVENDVNEKEAYVNKENESEPYLRGLGATNTDIVDGTEANEGSLAGLCSGEETDYLTSSYKAASVFTQVPSLNSMRDVSIASPGLVSFHHSPVFGLVCVHWIAPLAEDVFKKWMDRPVEDACQTLDTIQGCHSYFVFQVVLFLNLYLSV
ncbi:hypothetical protein V6N11_075427 [Hibiscus sabdariffa]|uniref:Uncharacterized protein n=1 Tax=Hibiscus sabdariffa TaxID=183260 RepID=A0ABR2R6G8_9ROSI